MSILQSLVELLTCKRRSDRLDFCNKNDGDYEELSSGYAKNLKGSRKDPSVKELQIGYVDGCFDLMHSGHYNAIRQSAMLCDKLVVGIHSDAEILANKGPPVLNQEERYGLLDHIKWIDRIVYDVSYSPSLETLDKAGAHFAVHGDDMPVNSEGVGAYDFLRDAGRLKIVKRTEGVSTTDFIGRLLSLTKEHHQRSGSTHTTPEKGSSSMVASASSPDGGKTLSQQGVKLLASTRRIAEFSKPHKIPTAEDTVVYCDGAWDMFHIGHASTLKKAKELGSFLIVGIHDDQTVNQIKGANYPIATLQERVLCVCACKWVDEVIIGAPLHVTEDMISTLNIKYIANGSHTETHHFREPGFTYDVVSKKGQPDEPYAVPRKMGILRTVKSDYPDLNTAVLAERVSANRLAYLKRNSDRTSRETAYYEEKKAKEKLVEG